MSGGSLDYLYNRVEEAAAKIASHYSYLSAPDDNNSEKRYISMGVAFSHLLFQVAKALKDIEWDMSGDGSDWKNVEKLIGAHEEAKAMAGQLAELLTIGEDVLKRLKEAK